MNHKYVVFNENNSIFQLFDDENRAIDFIEKTIEEARDEYREDGIMPKYVNDLCLVEVKYFVQNLELVKL